MTIFLFNTQSEISNNKKQKKTVINLVYTNCSPPFSRLGTGTAIIYYYCGGVTVFLYFPFFVFFEFFHSKYYNHTCSNYAAVRNTAMVTINSTRGKMNTASTSITLYTVSQMLRRATKNDKQEVTTHVTIHQTIAPSQSRSENKAQSQWIVNKKK